MRLLPSKGELEEFCLAELPLWAISVGASTWVIDLEPYQSCRVAGLVRQLLLDPLKGQTEATVTDGTGIVRARWPIRGSVAELAAVPPRAVILEGVPVIAEDAELVLLEPSVDIAIFPEVA